MNEQLTVKQGNVRHCADCKFAREPEAIPEFERGDEVVFCRWFSQYRAARLLRRCEEFEMREGGAA